MRTKDYITFCDNIGIADITGGRKHRYFWNFCWALQRRAPQYSLVGITDSRKVIFVIWHHLYCLTLRINHINSVNLNSMESVCFLLCSELYSRCLLRLRAYIVLYQFRHRCHAIACACPRHALREIVIEMQWIYCALHDVNITINNIYSIQIK